MGYNEDNLLEKKTWEFGGYSGKEFHRTFGEWFNVFKKLFPNEHYNPFLICPCCGEPFDKNSYPYMGAFRTAGQKAKFVIICKKCAFKMSRVVLLSGGRQLRLKSKEQAECSKD